MKLYWRHELKEQKHSVGCYKLHSKWWLYLKMYYAHKKVNAICSLQYFILDRVYKSTIFPLLNSQTTDQHLYGVLLQHLEVFLLEAGLGGRVGCNKQRQWSPPHSVYLVKQSSVNCFVHNLMLSHQAANIVPSTYTWCFMWWEGWRGCWENLGTVFVCIFPGNKIKMPVWDKTQENKIFCSSDCYEQVCSVMWRLCKQKSFFYHL